ncbi:MAG TPA: hypothetical protein VFT99_05855, partial [Roseiflexaceae bacterium]|nr:hypothetical protein [Roseiflexaceae bacterium]
CRQIITAFGGRPVDNWEQFAEQPVIGRGIDLHVVKDLSELGETQGIDVLRRLDAALHNPASPDRYLIAANEGRLRYLLGNADVPDLYTSIDYQIQHGVEPASTQLVVINLTDVTTSSFVGTALSWMTADEHWAACEGCPIRERCPIRHNANRLRDPEIARRVQLLYQLLEHLDQHVTIRDMLIHLAYTVTGNRHCRELQRRAAGEEDWSPFVYYENIWGRSDDMAFRRKASVVQHLERLHIGEHSLFEIDDFIVSGSQAPDEKHEHDRLFAPPLVDLDGWRFSQDRDAYLNGASARSASEDAQALRGWLPHCRRKLFFEWSAEARVTRLIPFLYLDRYQSLLRDERGVEEHVLPDLIKGLNRAFSRLYLNDADSLYVTTQYLHSGEQPRPLIRLRIPRLNIWLEPLDQGATSVYDCDRRVLHLVISPPPQRHAPANPALDARLRWPLGLLQFEYLLRLANGGTFNILAEECELDVRNLKDQLLSRFAGMPGSTDPLEFFVAERNHYSLKRLWIDEYGNIRG